VADLGNGQTLRFAQRSVAELQPSNFRFLDTLIAAPGYFDGSPEGQTQAPVDGIVLLSGGSGGVSLTSDTSGRLVASLTGTIYGPASVAPSVFVVEKQDGVTNYWNTVRGFRHGIDKIDLSQTGISRYEDLQLTKDERFQLNGFAQIHGVTVAGQGSTVKLLYLDALELAQVTADDFIFASPAAAGLPAMAPAALPNLANLVDAMAAFAPEPASSKLLAEAPTQRWESTIAVAA
jgi:hypothetical protein